jgi:hypothetical protein
MIDHKAAARRVARQLGATLAYRRTAHAQHVDIYLPKGMEFDGNEGLDALHHECELDEDIWPGVLADLVVCAA